MTVQPTMSTRPAPWETLLVAFGIGTLCGGACLRLEVEQQQTQLRRDYVYFVRDMMAQLEAQDTRVRSLELRLLPTIAEYVAAAHPAAHAPVPEHRKWTRKRNWWFQVLPKERKQRP